MTEPIETTCAFCPRPIRNRADEGRPDVWDHTVPVRERPFCMSPNPSIDLELPMIERTVRIRVTEEVTHIITARIMIHDGIPDEELPGYIDEREDLYADLLGSDTVFCVGGRNVDYDETLYVDDRAYLEALTSALPRCRETLAKWLTTICPHCGQVPGEDDDQHEVVGGYVAITCQDYRVINPDAAGVPDDNWKDWTSKPAA